MNKNNTYLRSKICVGLILIGALQGCESIANLARSPEGKSIICGGGALVTGAATGFGCNYLTNNKAGCVVLGITVALADGYFCWWKLSEKIIEDYDQTAETLKYNASQGYVVKILDFSSDLKTDWDLEAPGLEYYFRPLADNFNKTGGVISISDAKKKRWTSWSII